MERIDERMKAAWQRVAAQYPAYSLVLPGDPAFICQAQECTAHCCHAFSVSLGELEVERMAQRSGLAPSRFLESEDGEPLALPLLQPYLLSREGGHCSLLQDDMSCGQYDGRPDACRLYPFQVVLVGEDGPTTVATGEYIELALGNLMADEDTERVPLLLRHLECPGFTGEPLTLKEWTAKTMDVAVLG